MITFYNTSLLHAICHFQTLKQKKKKKEKINKSIKIEEEQKTEKKYAEKLKWDSGSQYCCSVDLINLIKLKNLFPYWLELVVIKLDQLEGYLTFLPDQWPSYGRHNLAGIS